MQILINLKKNNLKFEVAIFIKFTFFDSLDLS